MFNKKTILISVALCLICYVTGAVAADMSVTINELTIFGNKKVAFGTITLSSTSYTTGGLSLTAAMLGMDQIDQIDFTGDVVGSGYFYSYIHTTSKFLVHNSSNAHTHAFTGTAITADTFNVMDDNSAATNGRLLVLRSGDGVTGWFESLQGDSSTSMHAAYFDADSTLAGSVADTFWCGDQYVYVGLVRGDTVYFDDDGATQDRRLMYRGTNITSGNDVYVPVAGGRSIVVDYNSRAPVLGVPVYFDYNATAVDERWLAVNAGNADSGFDGDDTYYTGISAVPTGVNATSIEAAGSEVDNGTSLSQYIYFVAYGR